MLNSDSQMTRTTQQINSTEDATAASGGIFQSAFKMLKKCWSLFFPNAGGLGTVVNSRKRSFINTLSPGKTTEDGEEEPPRKRAKFDLRVQRRLSLGTEDYDVGTCSEATGDSDLSLSDMENLESDNDKENHNQDDRGNSEISTNEDEKVGQNEGKVHFNNETIVHHLSAYSDGSSDVSQRGFSAQEESLLTEDSSSCSEYSVNDVSKAQLNETDDSVYTEFPTAQDFSVLNATERSLYVDANSTVAEESSMLGGNDTTLPPDLSFEDFSKALADQDRLSRTDKPKKSEPGGIECVNHECNEQPSVQYRSVLECDETATSELDLSVCSEVVSELDYDETIDSPNVSVEDEESSTAATPAKFSGRQQISAKETTRESSTLPEGSAREQNETVNRTHAKVPTEKQAPEGPNDLREADDASKVNNAEVNSFTSEPASTTLPEPRSPHIFVGENPFQNEKVIQTIVRVMPDANTLLKCRRLSKKWKDIADTFINCHQKTVIRFTRDKDPGSLKGGHDLARVFNLCETFGDHPELFICRRFEFYDINLNELAFQQFLYSFGPTVSRLKLKLREDTSCLSWALLRQSVRNLEELNLLNVPRSWRLCNAGCRHDWQMPVFFPLLRRVAFPSNFSGFSHDQIGVPTIAQDLVVALPSLKDVIIRPAPTQPLPATPVKMLDWLSIEFFSNEEDSLAKELDYYVKSAYVSVKNLRTDNFSKLSSRPQQFSILTEVLSKILENSCDSLVRWDTTSLGFLFTLRVPELKNIKILNLYLNCEPIQGCPRVFDASVDLSNFQALSTVGILLGGESIRKYFPAALYKPRAFLTVTTLQCNMVLSDDWSTLLDIFPNVRNFEVTIKLAQLKTFFPWLFKSGISSLDRLKLYIEEDKYKYCYPFMDELITGLPESHCELLRSKNCRVSVQLIMPLRAEPSIENLKCLQKIDFVFQSRQAYEEHINVHPIITPVASVYGFKLIPGLQGNYFCRKA